MVKNNLFNSTKSLKLIKELLDQGADPHYVCTRKSCNYLTPWQEAEVIKEEHPEVLALFQAQFLTKSE